VSEVSIQDGKFTAVGRPGGNVENLDPCTRTIDLGGRTVVPGLIDNHNHIVLLGMRPGHDIRIETATSIADVQAMLRVKAATVPRGEFITTLGDWNAKQFAEKRAPTRRARCRPAAASLHHEWQRHDREQPGEEEVRRQRDHGQP
jgi:predicted amidohydrolase YtcJ